MTDFVLAGEASDATLPDDYDDQLLDGANGGVKFLFDLAFRGSYAGGPPANGAVVKDISAHGDGSVVLHSGQSLAFDSNGFDFSTLTAGASYLLIPPHACASIWGDGTTDQYFAINLYMVLPAKADWNPLSGLLSFLCFTTSAGGYTAETDLVTIAQSGGGAKTITARRQLTGGSTNTGCTLTPPDADFGGPLVSLMYWNDASGQGLRMISANGITTSPTVAPTAKNTANFSGKSGRLGIGPSFWPTGAANLSTVGNAKDFKIHRGWIEDLRVSGRNPATVQDADWSRVTGIRDNPFS